VVEGATDLHGDGALLHVHADGGAEPTTAGMPAPSLSFLLFKIEDHFVSLQE